MRTLPWFLCLLICCLSLPALAHNDNTTVVLHVTDGLTASCDSPAADGVDCETGFPLVDASGFDFPTVVMLLRNYDRVYGVQAAFDWPADWSLLQSTWGCQEGQLSAVTPTAPGPIAGSIATAFNPINGGTLETIGWLVFSDVTTGCLDIIDSGYPFGTHVVDIDTDPPETPLAPENWGRVCAGPGGYNACDPAATPIEATTWGVIKSHYR